MFSVLRQRWRLQLAVVGGATLLAIAGGTSWAGNFSWEVSPFSTNWDDPANWAGPLGLFPDSIDDTALVNGIPTTGHDPTLTSNRVIGALTISNNGDVYTGDGTGNNYYLVVNSGVHSGAILIEDPGSSLTIYKSGSLSDVFADSMTINSGGKVSLRRGRRNPGGQSAGY